MNRVIAKSGGTRSRHRPLSMDSMLSIAAICVKLFVWSQFLAPWSEYSTLTEQSCD